MKNETRLLSYKTLPGIFIKRMKQPSLSFVLCMVMFIQTGLAWAELPVTGVHLSELEIFDNLMQSFMFDNELEGGILAISKNGCVVYQRGFGYAYNGVDPLPENTPMRLASVEKPHTAAMIRHLVADGDINLGDFVFDVGQPLRVGQRALLDASAPGSPYYPYDGSYGDEPFLSVVTVENLLDHRGGGGIETGPDVFGILYDIGIATETYPTSPPAREDIVRYMMSQPMQFDPSNPVACDRDPVDNSCLKTPPPCYCKPYCNYCYMLLSLIIEQETGEQHTEMIRRRVLTPEIWVPSTEIIFGKDFRDDQNQREPKYIENGGNCTNLLDPDNIYLPYDDATVSCPYGGLLMEVKTGEGNLVGSAAPLLIYMDNYDAPSGVPITSAQDGSKNGSISGTSTMIRQWSDGFNIVALFNERSPDLHFARTIVADTMDLVDSPEASGIDWESLQCIDGFWVDFSRRSSGFGGHNDPFNTMDATLGAITDGTKLRIKPGTSNWSGTISTRTLIDAPFGTVIIGQ